MIDESVQGSDALSIIMRKAKLFFRWFLLGGIFSCCSAQAHHGQRPHRVVDDKKFDLQEITVMQIQERFAQGTLTSRQLVEFYLERIERLNHKGPMLHAVIETNPNSIEDAIKADNQRMEILLRRGSISSLGPLHGVPILVKDSIATLGPMQTTAGSKALEGCVVEGDATVVALLKKAGAVILGKSNLSEWSFFRGHQIGSGWSGRGGQAVSPYNPTIDPSGSSTGSAIAASANLAAVTLGGETDGSITSPSSAHGVVGLKPTVGLVSRHGAIPISHSQDSIGPITRTVSDAAMVLTTIASPDEKDPITVEMWSKFGHLVPKFGGYQQFLVPDGLNGARIGVLSNPEMQPKGYTHEHPEQESGYEAAKKAMINAGAILIDVDYPNLIETKESQDEMTVMAYEFQRDIASYLATLGNTTMRTLKDIVEYYRANPDGKDIQVFEESLMANDEEEYKRARERCLSRTRPVIDSLLASHNLDSLMAPTDCGVFQLAAMAGYPIISVPAGMSPPTQSPFGVAFVGGPFREDLLIRLAYGFEQATKARVPPKLEY